MHDNRGDKTSAKAPDFRCRNPDCLDPVTGRRPALRARDLLKSPPKAAAVPAPKPPATPAPAPAAADPFRDVAALHYRCLNHVLEHEAVKLRDLQGDVAGAVSALTAQLFIEIARRTNGKHGA